MFYNKKLVFIAVLYLMSAALHYFVAKQLVLTGIMSGFFTGSLVIFALIAAVCFLAAVIISFLIKITYAASCGIFKKPAKRKLAEIFWIVFTVLSYAAVFFIFFKMIEY
ncbi:MAG: hypothetical protein LBR69_02845 [Endomicrobium sp.]|jgi:hypothetical protein|nr:hypothetical protein [Endomicrobium sp.]